MSTVAAADEPDVKEDRQFGAALLAALAAMKAESQREMEREIEVDEAATERRMEDVA